MNQISLILKQVFSNHKIIVLLIIFGLQDLPFWSNHVGPPEPPLASNTI